jgi:hypothetical protein
MDRGTAEKISAKAGGYRIIRIKASLPDGVGYVACAIKKPAAVLAQEKLPFAELVLRLVVFLGLFHFVFSHLDGYDVDLVLGGIQVSL